MTLHMPAEWAPHERTLMCWPARADMWEAHFEAAKRSHAEVAAAVSSFEPVLMAVSPPQEAEARALLPGDVELFVVALDDSWARDSGPIFVAGGGQIAGVDFGFNAWGEKFHPYDSDAAFAAQALAQLGVARIEEPMILEGGSIAVDGEGALVTTEQCLLHPSRNPQLGRDEIEQVLRQRLGVELVVWLGQGLVEDEDTDGHVDNICAFTAPARVILQTVADEENPNFAPARENAARLRAAGIEVVELPWLPYADATTVVPYTNFYVCNGAVIVPTTGAETDAEALALIGAQFPGREVVAVAGETLALGGGGVHCITQQVPLA